MYAISCVAHSESIVDPRCRPFRLSCITYAMSNGSPAHENDHTIKSVYGNRDTEDSTCRWIANQRGSSSAHASGDSKEEDREGASVIRDLYCSDASEESFRHALEVGAQITKKQV